MIRYTNDKDTGWLFYVRNLPECVELSTLKRKVNLEEHLNWFKDVLNNQNILLFIIEPDIGTLRFERVENKAVISITILKAYRRKGYGLNAVEEGLKIVFEKWNIEEVTAYIRKDNLRSIKFFKKAGFIENKKEKECLKNHLSFHITKNI